MAFSIIRHFSIIGKVKVQPRKFFRLPIAFYLFGDGWSIGFLKMREVF